MPTKRNQTGTLQALMPGVSIKKNNGKILVNVATSNETILFNIGGTKFETYKATLHRLPNSPLADNSFLQRHYRADRKEYFFDRDPEIFKYILQYLRTGELHLPSSICGSAIKNELEFWGVEESGIEDCCWLAYNSWSKTLDSLKKLEEDRQSSMGSQRDQYHPPTESRLAKYQRYCWEFLNNPHWSRGAKVYGAISVFFVFLAIFSFVAQTHPYFTVDEIVSGQSSNMAATVMNMTANSSIDHAYFHQNMTSSQTTVKQTDHPALFILDCICFAFFLLEMFLRFCCCPSKIRFFTRPLNVIDMLALLPDVIGLLALCFEVHNEELEFYLSICRIARVFRSFRLMRFFPGLWILFYTLKASINELLLMLLFVIIGMMIFASLIYFAESRENFSSIPQSFWWALITMTTVGYGDMSPITNWGYFIGSMTAISGLLLIGFTVPVLVNNFILYYNHTQCAIEREKRRKVRNQELKRREKLEKFRMEKNGYKAVGQSESSNTVNGTPCV